jgi:hypothetical protein
MALLGSGPVANFALQHSSEGFGLISFAMGGVGPKQPNQDEGNEPNPKPKIGSVRWASAARRHCQSLATRRCLVLFIAAWAAELPPEATRGAASWS